MFKFYIYFKIICLIPFTTGFNISPFPNIIHNIPFLNMSLFENRASYFGFSLLLREKSLLVGAPRANSTKENMINIIEPGELYRCSNEYTKNCEIFQVESIGNIYNEIDEGKSEIKKRQWFGASISGKSTENLNDETPFIICAPRLTTQVFHLSPGVCYINRNNKNSYSEKIKMPMNLKGGSVAENIIQLGMASQWIKDQESFLLGIPSYGKGRGTFAVYNLKNKKLEINHDDIFKANSYGGFSLAATIFDKKQSFVVSAPRHKNKGVVIVINDRKLEIEGSQYGEYFGYAVITGDVNGDGINELIISAPLYSDKSRFEVGAVYVFALSNMFSNTKEIIIGQGKSSRGRFGLSTALLGDIDLDGYNDVAVGAPYEENGKVYIFKGSQTGLVKKPIQILSAPIIFATYNKQYFGFALSGGVDIDKNGVNDIAISSINLDAVFIYKSYQIINVDTYFKNLPDYINFTKSDVEFKTCILFISLQKEFKYNLIFELNLKSYQRDKRTNFESILYEESYKVIVRNNETLCTTHHVNITHENIIKPFVFELSYQLIQQNIENMWKDNVETVKSQFCTECVLIHPNDRNKIIRHELFIEHKCSFNTTCLSDLKVDISSKTGTLILDLDRSVTILITIENYKDPAYLPRVNIITNQHLPLIQTSSPCTFKNTILICNLWNQKEQILKPNEKKELTLTFDTSNVEGSQLRIDANVFSLNEEINQYDNTDFATFTILGCSKIEIIETSLPGSQFLNIHKSQEKTISFTKIFEIKNSGISTLSNLLFHIQYPHILSLNKSEMNIPFNSSENDILNTKYSEIKLSEEKLKEHIPTNLANQCTSTSSSLGNIYSESIKNISTNMKYVFDFANVEKNNIRSKCFAIKTIKPGVDYILTMEFQLKSKEMWNMLQLYKKDYLVYKLNFPGAYQNCDTDNCTPSMISFRTTIYEIIIKRVQLQKSALWIYVCSFILGIIVYLILAILFYKLGFFKRKKHEEVKEFKRQSIRRKSLRNYNELQAGKNFAGGNNTTAEPQMDDPISTFIKQGNKEIQVITD